MRWVPLVALLFTGCSACASTPKVATCPECPPTRDARPDLSRVATVAGIDGIAHACPIAVSGDQTVLLTARHVAMGRQDGMFDRSAPSTYAVSIEGHEGIARTVQQSTMVDIGIMLANFKIERPYHLATERPKEGDVLYFVDFDRRKNHEFQERDMDAQVQALLPGHILLDDYAQPGASGGCILNYKEEVVGIYVAILSIGDMKNPLNAPVIMGMAVVVDKDSLPDLAVLEQGTN